MFSAIHTVEKVVCPLCNDYVDRLLYRYHIDDERTVIEKIKKNNPDWTEGDGMCSRCIDYYQVAVLQQQHLLPLSGPHFSIKSADDFIILPVGLRVDAHPRFTGKGVTICFIDSGFYPHPDLVESRNRIKVIIDSTQGNRALSFKDISVEDASWHGTMTSVVCAGDGYLSNGLYKGIACDTQLVLIKVQKKGKITTAAIVDALQWVLDHHQEYNIRIVNISLGDDAVCSYKESEVDRLAELLIGEGITIVAAVGNDEYGTIHPPANSLHVIAIGGVDDENVLNNEVLKGYHSTYGITTDALVKPEMVAHSIWLAAPILPQTKEQHEAVILYNLLHSSEDKLRNELSNVINETGLDTVFLNAGYNDIKTALINRIQQCKYISPHYMHVDGTSFAAPIVTSVIAQLLEINPQLTPAMIREILFSTAKRMKDVPVLQQGFGVIQPRKAVLKVLKREQYMKHNLSPYINKEKRTIEFYIQNDVAEQISLAGSFNHWAQDVLLFEPSKDGVWKLELPMLNDGRYLYKFFIDSKAWVEDVDNPYREPDGFNGFNSILFIQN